MDNTSIYAFFFPTQRSHVEGQQITLLIALLRTYYLFGFVALLGFYPDCYAQPRCYSVTLTCCVLILYILLTLAILSACLPYCLA